MGKSRPFKSELVIDEYISTSDLKAYHIGFDQNQFRLQPLVDVIRSVIPEFALGYHCGENIPLTEMVARMKQAAATIYDTDKYERRGEFGELILHLLLRDFHNTIPLVSKIYFKDALNVNIHGFDGVQITINGNEKKLWLGESKLYTSGKAGIRDLLKDIKKHVTGDYLRKEFSLISRKLPGNIPEVDYWLQLMDQHQKLEVIFKRIVIPMVCTYTSDVFNSHACESKQYFADFEAECNELANDFRSKIPVGNVEIILMLMPVPSKKNLNAEIHKRLKAMQSI